MSAVYVPAMGSGTTICSVEPRLLLLLLRTAAPFGPVTRSSVGTEREALRAK